jgi:CRISPR associated protein Cas1
VSSSRPPRVSRPARLRSEARWAWGRSRSDETTSVFPDAGGPTTRSALLNLGYRLAEVEVRLQCLSMGIDPSFGVVHLDRAGRDGMVLDILEVTRPAVEAHVLDLVEQRTFRRSDFEQAPNGAVRVLMPLSHDVSVAMKAFGQAAAPYVEEVRNLLADGVETKIGRPTPLTRRQNKAGAAAVRARKALAAARAQADGSKRASQRSTSTAWVCPDCGGAVTDRHRVRCDACIDRDPRQTLELRAKRAAAISTRRQAEAAWEGVGMAQSSSARWCCRPSPR